MYIVPVSFIAEGRIKNDLLKFIYIYIDSLSLVTITVINVTKLDNTYVFKMCMQILKIN
jgi:hypothetical protein